MRLEPKERLTLALLYRILEKVSDDGENYAEYYEALEGGYVRDYPQEDHGLVNIAEEKPEEDCKEVWDILQMFDHFSIVLKRLKDKSGLDLELFKFSGFDGNNDWQYSYQVYIVQVLGAYSYILPEPLNSHGLILPHYRRMLAAWESVANKPGHYDLESITREDLLEFQKKFRPSRQSL